MKELDSIFSEADCRTILQKYFNNNNNGNGNGNENEIITFLWQKFESLSGDVDGYLSEHFSLKITYQEGAKTRQKKFFVKAVLNQKDGGFLADFAKAMDVFGKETFIYIQFIPQLRKALGQNYKPIMPECLFADAHSNVLVLEDLSEEGYQLEERLKLFNVEQCKMSLKTLSYYHAYSVIFEEYKSRELGRKFRLNEEYPEEFTDRFYGARANKSSPSGQFLQSAITSLIDLVEELPKDAQFKKHFAQLLMSSLDSSDEETKYRLTCTHCDLWASNIMFKYDEKHEIIDCKLIDFQMLNYTMPAYDVELFFYGNTTSEFRRQHKMELLRVYYDSFVKILKENNVRAEAEAEAEGILSFKDLEETCILRGPEAKIQAISDKSLLYLPQELLEEGAQNPDLFKTVLIDERSKYLLDVYRNNDEYRNFINSELLDLYDLLIVKKNFLSTI